MNSSSNTGDVMFAVFLPIFALVFLLVVFSVTTITFILPESYASTARILIQQAATSSPAVPTARPSTNSYNANFIPTELEVMRSELVLGQVVERLDLNTLWGKKYNAGEKLRTDETIGILKGRITLRPILNTSIIEITVFGEDPVEAAAIANEIAKAYEVYARSAANDLNIQIIDRAIPGVRPVRPNKPLSIVLGLVLGAALGALAGGAGAALTYRSRGKSSQSPAIP